MKTSSNITRTALAAVIGLGLTFAAIAQTTLDASKSTAPQSNKMQRKAARKAARVKKNAELGVLEKNGYNPAGDQTNYPDNLQNAEAKMSTQKKPSSGAASAP